MTTIHFGVTSRQPHVSPQVLGSPTADYSVDTQRWLIQWHQGYSNLVALLGCVPTSAGAPTVTPSPNGGYVQLYYDTTGNNLYAYNGAWKKVALA